MKSRPFVVDHDTTKRIKKVMEYAKANPYSMDDLLDVLNGHKEAPGLDKNFVCYIQQGYRVVYTEEYQIPGRVKHVSVSVSDKDPEALPGLEAVKVICKLFDFGDFLELVKQKKLFIEVEKAVYIEGKATARGAINVIEVI